MALKIKKTERESPQILVRRFTKALQQSGILLQARSNRFYQRPKSKTAKRKAALRRKVLREEYLKMKKMSKPGRENELQRKTAKRY